MADSRLKLSNLASAPRDTQVMPLYEPVGYQLHMDEDGRARLQKEPEQPVRKNYGGSGLGGTSARDAGGYAAPAPAARAMTPDEMMAKANAILAQADANDKYIGPALSPRDEAGQRLPGWLTSYMEDTEAR